MSATLADVTSIDAVAEPGAALEFEQFFLLPDSRPLGLLVGADQRLWFTLPDGFGAIRSDGIKRLYPRGAARPRLPMLGPDNRIWFLDKTTPLLQRVDTAGAYDTLDIEAESWVQLTALSKAWDGQAWVAAQQTETVWIVGKTGVAKRIRPDRYGLLVAAPNGDMWGLGSSRIYCLDGEGRSRSDELIEVTITLSNLLRTESGALWFLGSAQDGARVYRRDPAGGFKQFDLGAGVHAFAITAARGDGVWGTAYERAREQRIFYLRADGRLQWFDGPPNDPSLTDLIIAPDGYLWIVDNVKSRLIKARIPNL